MSFRLVFWEELVEVNTGARREGGNNKIGNLAVTAATNRVLGVIAQLVVVLTIRLGGNEKGKVGHEQELHLKEVDLAARNTAHLGKVGIVKILVIEELCSQHDAGNEKAMDVEGIDNEAGIALDDAIDVDQSKHETLATARGVVGNS